MIRLFPRSRKILLMGFAVTVTVTCIMIAAGERAFAIFVAITGAWISWYACLSSAIRAHGNVLSILYDELEPDRFMETYKPLLEKVRAGSSMEAAMRAHLGNALAAQGKYEEALAWYRTVTDKKDALLMQLENRCRCLFELDRVQELQQETEKWKALLPDVKKRRQNSSLHAMKLLEIRQRVRAGITNSADQLFVQQEMQGTNKRLHRCEMSLLIVQIYELMHFKEAEKLELESLSGLSQELVCCRKAREMLEAMETGKQE